MEPRQAASTTSAAQAVPVEPPVLLPPGTAGGLHAGPNLLRRESPCEDHRVQSPALHKEPADRVSPSPAMAAPEAAAAPPASDAHPLRHQRSSTAIRDLTTARGRLASPRSHQPHSVRSSEPRESMQYNPVHNPTAPVAPPEHDAPFGGSFSPCSDMEPRKRQQRGSMKAALRKFFGKKQRASKPKGSPAVRHDYHRSEPLFNTGTSIQLASESKPDSRPVTRPLSYSRKEFTRPNPLGSHLPFPMNVNAPECSDPDAYIALKPVGHRRRATLPSLVLTPQDIAISAAMDEGAEHVISTDGSSLVQAPDPPIGVAVTHNRQSKRSSKRQSNRRSRSASALQEYARTHSLEAVPRRSAEIRYWRASMASTALGPAEIAAETRNEPPPEVTPTLQLQTLSASPDPTVASLISAHSHQQSTSGTQTFDFGRLESPPASPPSTLRGPKEEDMKPILPITAHERMAQLEASMHSMNQSLQKLHARTNRQTIILSNAPPERQRSRDASSSSRSHSSRRRSPSDSRQPSTRHPDHHSLSHFSSVPSLNPTFSSASASHSERDRITALYTLLSHERSARKELETQFQQLQSTTQTLQSFVSTHIDCHCHCSCHQYHPTALRTHSQPAPQALGHLHAYPTPSPDQLLFATGPASPDDDAAPYAHRASGTGLEPFPALDVGVGAESLAATDAVRKSHFSFESDGDADADVDEGGSAVGGPVGGGANGVYWRGVERASKEVFPSETGVGRGEGSDYDVDDDDEMF